MSKPEMRIQQILKEVSDEYGISHRELITKTTREPHIADAKADAAKRLRNRVYFGNKPISYAYIAKKLGYAGHTSVLAAIRRKREDNNGVIK